MERKRLFHIVSLALMTMFCIPVAGADNPRPPYTFEADVAGVSKYIWRGQRLTNDWSLQPEATLGIGNFSLNVWGNMDLAAVNEGDALFIRENPAAPPGDHSGLRGRFSEVDYTLSYAFDLSAVSFDVGTIFYTFPDRSASLPATTEIYGGVAFGAAPLSPSATLYVDVDESRAEGGSTGLYLAVGAEHQFLLGHRRFPGLDVSASLGLVNDGFCRFYYGTSGSGPHDFSLTLGAPISLGERWSAGAFLAYSALLRDFRGHQLRDPRGVYRGTAGSPATFADTIWGGFTLSLAF
jgi:hypothetical protein